MELKMVVSAHGGAGSALPWVLTCGVMVDHCCDGAQGGGCLWVTPLSMGFQYAALVPLAKRDFSWSISDSQEGFAGGYTRLGSSGLNPHLGAQIAPWASPSNKLLGLPPSHFPAALQLSFPCFILCCRV